MNAIGECRMTIFEISVLVRSISSICRELLGGAALPFLCFLPSNCTVGPVTSYKKGFRATINRVSHIHRQTHL